MKKYEKQEYVLYAVLWIGAFTVPLLNAYGRVAFNLGSSTDFSEVADAWIRCLPYFVAFLIHNFFIAPLLMRYHRRWLYAFLLTILLIALTISWFKVPQQNQQIDSAELIESIQPFANGPGNGPGGPGGPNPEGGVAPPFDGGGPGAGSNEPRLMADADSAGRSFRPRPGMDGEAPDSMHGGPFGGMEGNSAGNDGMSVPPEPRNMDDNMNVARMTTKESEQSDMLVDSYAIVVLLVGFLIMGLNLGVKFYFKSERKSKETEEVKRQKLEEQIKYLKYQISPHFFMNTLNNIYVLIDVYPEQAKRAILDLSKMMRSILYEGDHDFVSLRHEANIVNEYIALMKLRFTEKVSIITDIPEELPESGLPPLLLVCFVENAFKHGISYQQDSFVSVRIRVDNNRLHFVCINSIPPVKPKTKKEQGGVGLVNVKRRLTLIYGRDYTLDIRTNDDEYCVVLDLPLRNGTFSNPKNE